MGWFRRRSRSAIVTDRAIPRFVSFGGRRHIADAPYVLPKDFDEIRRLDFQHFLLRFGLQGNYLAPLQNPLSILDVGCGTGRWAMEMAALFPAANVFGVDLNAPEEVTMGYGLDRRPENYAFVSGNVLQALPFENSSFDYVHERLLVAAIPEQEWPHVISEMVRVARAGGWVEMAECGVPTDHPADSSFMRLWGTWIELCRRRGIDFTMGRSIGDRLKQAELRDVHMRQVNFPMGNYGGHVGRASATDCLAVGAALRQGVVGLGVMSAEEYDRLYEATKREFANPRGQAILPFYVACGQKA
jgi:SAM-dependent methyltransferase